MKIKGHAKVELIDAKSGEVKRTVEQDNTVTGFSNELLMDCGNLMKPVKNNYMNSDRWLDDMFGGIMLFDEQILQDYDDTGKYNTPIYTPAGVAMVGNGTIDITDYSGNCPYFGEYDSTASETAEATNNTKRTYVYEWSEAQAVGTIKSICLTSRIGGYVGAGQEVKFNSTNNKWEAYFDKDTKYYTLKQYTNSINNEVENQSGSYDNRNIFNNGGSENNQTVLEALFKICTIDVANSCVICLKELPKDCLNSGVVTLQWYNLPIKRINPFIDYKNFVFDAKVNEVTINLHEKNNDFPENGFGTSITYARVMSGINSITLIGITTNYSSGNYSGRLTDNSTLYAVKLYKDAQGEWQVKYKTYSNIQGIPTYVHDYITEAIFLGSPTNIGFRHLLGGILDSPFIPQNNQYYDALFIGGSFPASNGWNGSIWTGGGTDQAISLVIKSDGTVVNLATFTTNNSSSFGRVFFPNESDSYAHGRSLWGQGFYTPLSGRLCLDESLYWDPILDKYFQLNILRGQYGWGSTSYGFNLTFDSYNYASIRGTRGVGTSVGLARFNRSPLSMLHMDCNWLSTIANIGAEGITKGPNEKLRITYTLDFDPTA